MSTLNIVDSWCSRQVMMCVCVCVCVGCAFDAKILLSAVFGFKGGGVVV